MAVLVTVEQRPGFDLEPGDAIEARDAGQGRAVDHPCVLPGGVEGEQHGHAPASVGREAKVFLGVAHQPLVHQPVINGIAVAEIQAPAVVIADEIINAQQQQGPEAEGFHGPGGFAGFGELGGPSAPWA